ncbi:hypothetical protein FD723_39860 (plasmid) [Nostoc sp. C052]|uniref:hypothetical protein n=1 Tax=Nostoc sp. C052 TaxID=2576902 RepID=UPI0015C3E5A7|nr:hypothetical protein [Nostoc sp. C052]QLE46369.1 hypothetical protein FD723_39860 [Nostoc sp. C052]
MVNTNKISSAIQGSLNNLVTGDVPNFQRSTLVWLEYQPNGSLKLEPVSAHQPAIDSKTGSIILEPSCVNYVTHNIDLSQNVWIKGSHCIIFPDEVESPDATTYQADLITWTIGEGLTQSLKRTIVLDAGETYTMSLFLLLPNGQQASDKDVIRLNSGVVGKPTIKLSQLNNFQNRYQILEVSFQANGRQISLPKYSHDTGYAALSISSSTVTLSTNTAIAKDQFSGGQIQFEDSTQFYDILANTAGTTSSTLTLDTTNLIKDGITIGRQGRIHGAESQTVELEFYVESTLSLYFGGIQIEKHPFRTSMIYQGDAYKIRAASLLSYRRNLLAGLKTLSIFVELQEWRGDGILFDAGNLVAKIVNGSLVVETSSSSLTVNKQLPKYSKLLIQISEENTNISVYVNKILEARASVYNFVGDRNSAFSLTSDGYRAIAQIVVFDKLLFDGQVEIGQTVADEVAELFDSAVIIDSKTLSANTPPIVLPPITIPAPPEPIAKSQIRGVSINSSSVTVEDATKFIIGLPVSVVREGRTVLTTKALTKTGNVLQLEVIYGVVMGDFLVYGNVDQPGVASVRFPYTPIDQAKIIEIDPTLRRLKIASSLSFTKQRAFVSTIDYLDIAEVKITNIDNTNGYLFLESVEGIEIGHLISQAKDELFIDPDCYEAYLLDQVAGVSIDWKFMNGLRLTNRNSVPIQVQAAIRASTY